MVMIYWAYFAVILLCLLIVMTLFLLRHRRSTFVFIGVKAELVFWVIFFITLYGKDTDKIGEGTYIGIIVYASIRAFTLVSIALGNPERPERCWDIARFNRRKDR